MQPIGGILKDKNIILKGTDAASINRRTELGYDGATVGRRTRSIVDD
jgi:hypothetical protein